MRGRRDRVERLSGAVRSGGRTVTEAQWVSVVVVLVGFGAVALVAVGRHAELSRMGVPYWTPMRKGVLIACGAGFIALLLAQWAVSLTGQAPVH